jgi:hypothetical protein
MKKNYRYLPKEEFRKRLLFLKKELDLVLNHSLSCPQTQLMPALYGVFSYMWCKRQEDLYKKVYSLTEKECIDKMFDMMGLAPVPDGAKLLPLDCELVSNGDDTEIPF